MLTERLILVMITVIIAVTVMMTMKMMFMITVMVTMTVIMMVMITVMMMVMMTMMMTMMMMVMMTLMMTLMMAMMDDDDGGPHHVYIHLDARPNKAWSSELFLLCLHTSYQYGPGLFHKCQIKNQMRHLKLYHCVKRWIERD